MHPSMNFCLNIFFKYYSSSISVGVKEEVVENDEDEVLVKSKLSKNKKADKKKRNHVCFEPGCNRSYTSIHHLKVSIINCACIINIIFIYRCNL